jgi:hypothetical protein
VAIDDEPARSGDRDDLDLVGARRGGKGLALHELHLGQPRDDRDERQRERPAEPQHARKLMVLGDPVDRCHQL